MNQNPWHVDNMARYERGRIQEEMRQIRLLEEALNGRVRPPSLRRQVWRVLFTWIAARLLPFRKSPRQAAFQPRARKGESEI